MCEIVDVPLRSVVPRELSGVDDGELIRFPVGEAGEQPRGDVDTAARGKAPDFAFTPAQRDALTASYQRSYDAVTVETMLLSIVGLAAVVAITAASTIKPWQPARSPLL